MILPNWFLNESPRFNINCIPDGHGFCINCGCKNNGTTMDVAMDNIDYWLKLILLGKVRTTEIDCQCGCNVGMFDLDIEEYRAWDISE